MRFPALQSEIVERPIGVYRGAGTAIWCMWHRARVYRPIGNRWWDVVVKDMALYIHDYPLSSTFTVWMYTQPAPDDRHFIYLTFAEPLETDAWLLEIARMKTASGTESNGVLPDAAVPVLKHETTGNLLRLWSPPGPDIPEVQRVKVEWATIRLTNRYYVMEQNGMQSE